MASISEERLREMEEEMDRFEAEIQAPGGPAFILKASTYEKVQAQLTSLRQESSRLQQKKDNLAEDVDFRRMNTNFTPGHKRKFPSEDDDDDENEFHDIDERPGRPQGPLVPPPPPVIRPPMVTNSSNLFVPLPPPPPPPEPDLADVNHTHSTLSFKPYGPGEGPQLSRPAFLPPQLRHRAPPPGLRPPFPRPPMRMGVPPLPFGGPMGFPRPPHMVVPGTQVVRINPVTHPGLPVAGLGVPVAPGPQIIPQAPPGIDPPGLQFMTPALETSQTDTSAEQSKVVYAAAPVITVERKKEEKKKKKKKKKGLADAGGSRQSKDASGENVRDTQGSMSGAPVADEDQSVLDMEIVPESALVGGIMVANMSTDLTTGATAGGGGGTLNPQGAAGKKEKKKKDKKFLRLAANTTWEDPTLAEWQQDDFRMFCGDLGNEVTDETLVRAFNKYPSFLKAKVIRDRRTNKTKGYGFVSFKDPLDFARAMREMNGKYVGNRPIKLRKSSWKDRNLEIVRKKEKEKKKLGLR